MSKDNVIPFPKDKEFHKFLDQIREDYDEGRIRDFALIYRAKVRDGEEPEGGSRVGHWWFGEESTLFILGLLERMKNHVQQYMDEKDEEYREGQ